MNKAILDKEDVIRLYEGKGLPMHKVAKELGCSVGKLYNFMTKNEMHKRPPHKGALGMKHSKESLLKMSKAKKGKTVSESSRKKMSEAKKIKGIGHKKKRADGYISIYFPDHPRSNKDGYIMEHILVAESVLGRWIAEDEIVHHINHKRDDNRKDNLKVMTKHEHMSMHMKERWSSKRKENENAQ